MKTLWYAWLKWYRAKRIERLMLLEKHYDKLYRHYLSKVKKYNHRNYISILTIDYALTLLKYHKLGYKYYRKAQKYEIKIDEIKRK